jgi:hypothetical protein
VSAATLRILGLLLVVVGACAPTAAPGSAPATASVEAGAPALAVGQVHRYALDWQSAATRSHAGAGVSGAMTLQGELAVAAIGHGPEGTRVSAWFPRLSTHELRVQGQPTVIYEAALVGPRAEFIVAADGDVRRAFFASDSPPIFRELMLGVIARLDLRAASAGAATRTLRGGHGLVEATYRRDPDGAVIRELAGVLRFDSAPGASVDADALTAEARIVLDDARMPVRIELHDSAALSEQIGLVADERFSLVRTVVEPASVVALVDPIELDPTEGPDLAAAALELDRQYAAGYTVEDLEIAMTTVDGGVLPHEGEISRAAASLRAWPERAAQLVPLARLADSGGRQLAFDALSAAGTPEAQAVMCSLLAEAQAAGWPERMLLVQRFAFVAAPTPASGEFLLELLAGAERAGDAQLRQAVLLPFGSVTRRMPDAVLGERMHAVLVAHAQHEDVSLRAAAVAGLGNAARAEDAPRLLAALADPQAEVRAEAADALRSRVTPETTGALLAALADEDAAVASHALRVLRKHHFQGAADPALVERARLGQYNDRLHRAMASTLVGSRDQPDVQVALTSLARRSSDPQLAVDLGLAR